MIKKYSRKKDGEKFVSKHFQVKEFGSFSGAKWYSDEIPIDGDLVIILEKVFNQYKCSKAIISSGYRTKEHDLAVGGSGSGYHLTGQAADICFYDSFGKPIPSKEICFFLQDIGVYGIGHGAGGSSVHTHIDTRPAARKWFGDESTNYVATSDWYTYFKTKPANNTLTYAVQQDGKWTRNVKNGIWVGTEGKPITALIVKASRGYIKYRVKVGGRWLPYVTGHSKSDDNNGYAGNGKPIEAIEVRSTSGNTVTSQFVNGRVRLTIK